MKTKQPSPIVFPSTFYADLGFRIGLPAFTLFGTLGWYINFKKHDYITLAITTTIILVCACLTVAALSYRLLVDDEGFHLAWILGRRKVAWTEIDHLEKTKLGYGVYNTKSEELVPLSVLTHMDQKAIADETIARTKLVLQTKKVKYPVLELWSR